MKSLLYLFLLPLLFLMSSCQSENDNVSPSEITEKWKLTQIVYTSTIAGKLNTPIAPPYEEIFELKADGTFRRYRSTGYEATGTYSVKQYSTNEYGYLAIFDDNTLTYHELADYRQYSFTKGQVYLRQLSTDVLVESYIAADGPAFYYHKIEGRE